MERIHIRAHLREIASRFDWRFVGETTAIVGIVALSIILFRQFFIEYDRIGVDFIEFFMPATRAALSGVSPYTVDGFISPPWVLLAFLPFSIFPESIAFFLFVPLMYTLLGCVIHKLGAKPIVMAAILASPGVFASITNGNIDALVALGFILPPQLGLIFVTMKPQLGAPVAAWIVFDAFRRGGIREVVRVSWPLAIMIMISIFLFRDDLLNGLSAASFGWNISNWPYLLPIGAVLTYRAFKFRKKGLAIVAGPFTAPYVSALSLPFAILGLLPSQTETLIATFSLWMVWVVRGTGG